MAIEYQSSTKLIPDRAIQHFKKAEAIAMDLEAIKRMMLRHGHDVDKIGNRNDAITYLERLARTEEQHALHHIKQYLKEQ